MRADRTPILVGVAQVAQRVADPQLAKEPLTLMIEAARAAAEDAGAPALLTEANAIRVIRGMWPYENPAQAVADAIGNPGAETGISCWGGNSVQSVLTESALEIAGGERDIVILAGAECGATQARARRSGTQLAWSKAPGQPHRVFGVELRMRHRAEASRGVLEPIHIYPIFENAIRHARGETLDAHMRRVSELWAGFSEVAAGNPHAWIREPKTAAEIREPSAANRQVSFPYPKLMNSNSNVDQGAALILTCVETARRLGLSEDKWVYPWAATEGHDTYVVSHRDTLHTAPGLRIAGRRCLELAGVEVDDLGAVDVYSCFPSAVQVSAAELGLNVDAPLTVTGGLTFGGGPLNNYVMHAIARMVEVLRERPDKPGFVTSNGGFLTKHAFGVYGMAPPRTGFCADTPQAAIDATPHRELAETFEGAVQVESYTAVFQDGEPTQGLFACLAPDGRRTWGNTSDRDTLQAMVSEEFCGKDGWLDARGAVSF